MGGVTIAGTLAVWDGSGSVGGATLGDGSAELAGLPVLGCELVRWGCSTCAGDGCGCLASPDVWPAAAGPPVCWVFERDVAAPRDSAARVPAFGTPSLACGSRAFSPVLVGFDAGPRAVSGGAVAEEALVEGAGAGAGCFSEWWKTRNPIIASKMAPAIQYV